MLVPLILCSVPVFGAPGEIDTTFQVGSDLNADVESIVVQPDGKPIIAGYFRSVRGGVRIGVARLHKNGLIDESFNPGPEGIFGAHVLLLQPDGKVVVAGSFATVGGLTRHRLARLNADGRVDSTFDPGEGPDSDVRCLALQADGKFIIAGDFTKFGATNRKQIARLTANGRLDESFDPGASANGYINAVAMQPDGKIVVAGSFTEFNGLPRKHIARLHSDGSVDLAFDSGAGAVGIDDFTAVHALIVKGNQQILIGGSFTNFNGAIRHGVAQLNSTGAVDHSFDLGDPFGPDQMFIAFTMLLQSDGRILVGGVAYPPGGYYQGVVVRLAQNGAVEPAFHLSFESGGVAGLALQEDGGIFCAGSFSVINGTVRPYVALLKSTGDVDPGFGGGAAVNGSISAIAMQADGKVVIGGSIRSVGNLRRRSVVRLNTDGTLDSSFTQDLNSAWDMNAEISDIAIQGDGKVLIGGEFSFMVDDSGYQNLVRFNADGTLDKSFQAEVVPYDTLFSIAIQPDGKIVAVGGVDDDHLVRLNSDGSRDSSFAPDPITGGSVMSVALQADGKILIGGHFTRHGGINRLNPDGSEDDSFRIGIGADDPFWRSIKKIVVQPDQKIMIAGSFTTIQGVRRKNIARLHPNGTVDMEFGFEENDDLYAPIWDIAVQTDGKTLIVGEFTSIQGIHRSSVARLGRDGRIDPTFDPGLGASDVYALALQTDGKVIVGGGFGSFDGRAGNSIVRLHGNEHSPALSASWTNGLITVSWPVSEVSFRLQANTAGVAVNAWVDTTPIPTTHDGRVFVSLESTNRAQFFRLTSP